MPCRSGFGLDATEVRVPIVEGDGGLEKGRVGEVGKDIPHILGCDDQILRYGSRSNTSMVEAAVADTWDMVTAREDAADAKGCDGNSMVD